ncbi:MAG: alginate export family protein [Bacteroidota bacterium]
MIKKVLIAIALLLFISTSIRAQYSLSGEFRPRSEYRHGFGSLASPGDDAAFFISQRTRLNFGYNNTDVKVFISLQDIRVWGEVPQLNRSDLNTSIHEAWAEFPLSSVLSLKLGRQEVLYDNVRIFGNVDWAQQGRSHDMALAKLNLPSGINVHAGFAFNQEAEKRVATFYPLSNYKTLQYLWLNYKPNNTGISFMALNLGFQENDNNTAFNQTLGTFITHSIGRTQLEGSFYYQMGKDPSNRDLNAWYLGAEARAPMSEKWMARGGIELLSGTDMQQTEQNQSFTPWFGTNHKFNGHMDYFYVGNHINNVGLSDVYISVNYNYARWLAMATLHNFWAEGNVTAADDPSQSMKAYLGTEIDFMVGYAINPAVAFRMGYSQMFATETMERIKGGSKDETQNWAWAMIIIKPRFI